MRTARLLPLLPLLGLLASACPGFDKPNPDKYCPGPQDCPREDYCSEAHECEPRACAPECHLDDPGQPGLTLDLCQVPAAPCPKLRDCACPQGMVCRPEATPANFPFLGSVCAPEGPPPDAGSAPNPDAGSACCAPPAPGSVCGSDCPGCNCNPMGTGLVCMAGVVHDPPSGNCCVPPNVPCHDVGECCATPGFLDPECRLGTCCLKVGSAATSATDCCTGNASTVAGILRCS